MNLLEPLKQTSFKRTPVPCCSSDRHRPGSQSDESQVSDGGCCVKFAETCHLSPEWEVSVFTFIKVWTPQFLVEKMTRGESWRARRSQFGYHRGQKTGNHIQLAGVQRQRGHFYSPPGVSGEDVHTQRTNKWEEIQRASSHGTKSRVRPEGGGQCMKGERSAGFTDSPGETRKMDDGRGERWRSGGLNIQPWAHTHSFSYRMVSRSQWPGNPQGTDYDPRPQSSMELYSVFYFEGETGSHTDI